MNASISQARPERAALQPSDPEERAAEPKPRLSLLRYSPAIILIMIVFVNMGRTTDPDLWGSLRYGQTMWSSGHFLLHDAYSYSAAGDLWRDHKWLSDIIMALLYDHFGVIGLKLWRLACTSGTLVFMTLALAETGASPTVQLCALAGVPVVIGPADLRPLLLTFFLFAALLALLARDTYRGPSRLWVAIPMMALWSNLHGGFVVGVAMLTVYAGISAARDLLEGDGFRRSRRLILVAAASILVTFATPHPTITWGGAIHTLRNPIIGKIIEEWQPLTSLLAGAWHLSFGRLLFLLCALASTAALIILFLLTPRRQDLPLIAIAAMMIAAGFVAVRNVPLAAMACAVPIARHAELALRPRLTAKAKEWWYRPPIRSATWYILVATGLLSLMLKGRIFSSRLLTDQPYPSGAVAFMQRHQLHGNLLNAYNWGQYLIWYAAPAMKVFVDGRCESLYPIRVLEDYVIFYFDLPGADQVLRSYPHDFVLIPPNARAHELMQTTAGWKLIYYDRDCELYAHDGSAAMKVKGIPVAGTVPGVEYFH